MTRGRCKRAFISNPSAFQPLLHPLDAKQDLEKSVPKTAEFQEPPLSTPEGMEELHLLSTNRRGEDDRIDPSLQLAFDGQYTGRREKTAIVGQ